MSAQPSVPDLARLTGVLVAASVLASAGTARAQAARRFEIPAGSLSAALLEFAVQAQVSISIGGAARCKPNTSGLAGRFKIEDGLARLLAGSGCTYRLGPDGSVSVFLAQGLAPAGRRPIQPGEERAGPLAPAELREIVVTAARRSALVDRAPYSVSALTGEDLRAIGAEDLNAAAPMLAGVSMTDLGPGRDKIFIRGLSDSALTGKAQSTVGIYLDDARITYNAPDPDLRLVDVQRVEVLRGPQGALYGAGSIGGILHIVTNKPAFDAFTASAAAGVSATVGGEPGGWLEGIVNAPLIADRAALRLVVYDERHGGYLDDVRLGLQDVNSVRRRGVRAALAGRIGSDWTVTASVVRQTLNSADAHYVAPTVGPQARDVFVQEPHDNDFLAASLNVSGRLDWADVTATSSVLRHEFNSRYDATLALPRFAAVAGAEPSPFDETNRAELLVNELTAVSPQAGRLRWLAGAFQSLGDNDSTSVLTAPLGAGGASTTVYREDRYDLIRELAAHGQVSYELWPRTTLTAGGRWFRTSVKSRSQIAQPLAGVASAFVGKTISSGFAPQLVLQVRTGRDVTLYAQASEGYRSGGFNTSGLPGQAFSDGGVEPQRRYVGDELWSYEAGAKFSLVGGAARIRAAAFYMLWKNVQSEQLLANGLPYTANIGDGRDLGWEIEADVQPAPRWRIKANATLAEPELAWPKPAFASRPDNGLPGAAKFQAGVAASYQQPLGERLALRLETTVSYVGGSHLTLDAATSPEMGDYAIARFAAELMAGRWTATAFVEGPLGTAGDTFAYGNPFSFRSLSQATPVPPTAVGFELGVRLP